MDFISGCNYRESNAGMDMWWCAHDPTELETFPLAYMTKTKCSYFFREIWYNYIVLSCINKMKGNGKMKTI
ncbi:MAG: hypothetical protein IKK94_01900, partial [Clostridia bacterium]|nr:hypothetical protein [Clostridia bacterium]